MKGLEALERIKATLIVCKKLYLNESAVAEIEKELKALEIIKDLFDFDFALRFPSNQPMLRITNKRTNEYWEIPITQEKQDLLKEVML